MFPLPSFCRKPLRKIFLKCLLKGNFYSYIFNIQEVRNIRKSFEMIYFNYRHFQTIQTILKHKLCVNIHDWSLCVNIIFGDIFQKIFQFMCIYSMIRP